MNMNRDLFISFQKNVKADLGNHQSKSRSPTTSAKGMTVNIALKEHNDRVTRMMDEFLKNKYNIHMGKSHISDVFFST